MNKLRKITDYTKKIYNLKITITIQMYIYIHLYDGFSIIFNHFFFFLLCTISFRGFQYIFVPLKTITIKFPTISK